jgi:nicotinate phosphoribosyltransferase
VEYKLIVRSSESLLPYIAEIKQGIDALCEMRFAVSDLRFLADPQRREYIKPDFVRFLEVFQLNPRYVNVSSENSQLAISVSGPWLHCIMFEQPLLAMLSEIRNHHVYPDVTLDQVSEKLYRKFDWLVANCSQNELDQFRVTDFGTRRRLSFEAHRHMVDIMVNNFPGQFQGTSNPHIAHEMNIPLIGTMAHQWMMAYQQMGRLDQSQSQALEGWVKEYRGRLGIALTDCISSDFFLSEFDPYFSKLFDGVRHDSGEPKAWADQFIAHYQKLGINPESKTLVFSDGLNMEKCLEILRHVDGRARVELCMGTNLACDVDGVKPLSIVMKLVKVNGQPVVKFSDDPVKVVCEDESFLNYAKSVFSVQ